MTRLVAILGYSDRSTPDLHAVCAARLERAQAEAGPDDVILFSGWARGSSAQAEADLMAASWTGPGRTRLVDREARTTLGNVLAVARAARRVGADEVILVTSRWHARRAGTLARAALGRRARLRIAASDEPRAAKHGAREMSAWLVLPILAVVALRNR